MAAIWIFEMVSDITVAKRLVSWQNFNIKTAIFESRAGRKYDEKKRHFVIR